MNKIKFSSLLLLGVIAISCANNNDPSSQSPSSDTRDNFVGYWVANETSNLAGTNTHSVNIIKSTTNSTEILLNNFSGLSVSARASVSNNNILTIPYQMLGSIGFTQGTGTLTNAATISFNYTNTINANPADACSAVYSKQ